MKTLLINPPVWDTRAPPLNLAYLSAYAKKNGFDVKCIDMNIELFNLVSKEKRKFWLKEYNAWWHNSFLYHYKLLDEIKEKNIQFLKSKILKYKPDVVGFTLNISPPFVIDFSREIKEKLKDVTIVVGGNSAERYFYGDSLLKSGFIDVLVLGEGEETFLEILNRIKAKQTLNGVKGTIIKDHNKIIVNPRRERILRLDEIPFPDFSDFDLSLYKERDYVSKVKYLPALFSRGCINNCDYCAQNQIWGKPFLMRSPENMFSEIKFMIRNYHIRNFIFSDLEINGDLHKLERFCDLIIQSKEKIKWEGSAIIRNDMNMNLIKKMKKAGCSSLDLGLESGSETVLKEMGKFYTQKEAKEFFHKLKKEKIHFGVSVIVGHPKEGKAEFKETLDFIEESKNDMSGITPGVSSCAIFPKTPLYNKFPKFGQKKEREKALDWQIDGNDFDERKKRIKRFNEVSKRVLKGSEIKITDGKIYNYTEKESLPNPILEVISKPWKNNIYFFGSDSNYFITFLKTIHREDLIDFYKNRIRTDYGIDFQYKEENNSQIYPIYPNLIKTKHFRIKGEYVGSDEKLTFYLKIPKNISLLQIKLPLTGIKGKSTFTAVLNNKSIGTFTVNQMSKGDAEIIELTTDDVTDLIKKEIVKFELQIKEGNLAIYEKYNEVNGIKITYPKPLKPSNEYSIYTPYRNGQVIEYNNQDNFNKGYKFLILEENSELFYPLKHDVSELQIQLASITENTIAQINSTQIKPIQLASGKGKIYTIKIKSNLIKIKCRKGKLAVLQDPIENDLPKTPLQVKYLN